MVQVKSIKDLQDQDQAKELVQAMVLVTAEVKVEVKAEVKTGAKVEVGEVYKGVGVYFPKTVIPS